MAKIDDLKKKAAAAKQRAKEAQKLLVPKAKETPKKIDKSTRAKFTTMIHPVLSKALKMKALQKDVSAADYLEQLLINDLGVTKDELY